LNTGAALFIAGRADSVKAGIARGAEAIDSGSAHDVLARLVRMSNEAAA
ncbi:MAG: anthranilate phosphoribosyltransferase, partial [Acidobacteria bacterium]|nr:anthranilate phosphoribosyltransferase [Acidobacteriota bacterium]